MDKLFQHQLLLFPIWIFLSLYFPSLPKLYLIIPPKKHPKKFQKYITKWFVDGCAYSNHIDEPKYKIKLHLVWCHQCANSSKNIWCKNTVLPRKYSKNGASSWILNTSWMSKWFVDGSNGSIGFEDDRMTVWVADINGISANPYISDWFWHWFDDNNPPNASSSFQFIIQINNLPMMRIINAICCKKLMMRQMEAWL